MNIVQAEEQMEIEIKNAAKALKGKCDPEKYVFVIPLITYQLYLDKYYKENYHLYLFYKKVRIFWSDRVYRDSYVSLMTKEDFNAFYNPCDFVKVI